MRCLIGEGLPTLNVQSTIPWTWMNKRKNRGGQVTTITLFLAFWSTDLSSHSWIFPLYLPCLPLNNDLPHLKLCHKINSLLSFFLSQYGREK